ncbi:hypothetical protein D3C72_1868880 [compost metagenome]
MVEKARQGIEAAGPELLVAREPHGGLLHRARRQLAAHDAARLRARDEAGAFEHAQVLHEAGQRHAMRFGELGHAEAALTQRFEHAAAGRVGQGRKHGVQGI